MRDVLINEAEKVRACIRIGDGYTPFKSRSKFPNNISPLAANWLQIGQNATRQEPAFKNDLKDIIELSRASAAISAARPGMLDEDKVKMSSTTEVKTDPITTTLIQSSTNKPPPTQTITKRPFSPTTTFMPFLGVKVVEEMEHDVFEGPSTKAVSIPQTQPSRIQNSPTTIKTTRLSTVISTTTQQPSTKKFFKSQTEKLSSGRKEFTVVSATTTRKPIPIVQNAVPLFNPSAEKTTYVPTWRRTTTPAKL